MQFNNCIYIVLKLISKSIFNFTLKQKLQLLLLGVQEWASSYLNSCEILNSEFLRVEIETSLVTLFEYFRILEPIIKNVKKSHTLREGLKKVEISTQRGGPDPKVEISTLAFWVWTTF